MKTLVFSMLAMAAMVSCTSESDPIEDIDNGQPVEIKASAGIGEIITKTAGVITEGINVDDIEFIKAEGADIPTNWATATLTAIDATIGSNGLQFTSPQYYNPDPTIKSHLIGYHPKAAGSATKTANSVSYTITGQEDIMCTTLVSGDKTANKSKDLEFTFEHQLAQYTFKIKAADEQAVTTWGKIKSINLINQQTTATLTLNTKAVAFTGDSNQDIIVGTTETSFDSTDPINTLVQFGSPIMVKPGQTEMKVKVVTENNANGIEVPLTVASVASTSYIVTLTFKATEIGATATIGEWLEDSGTGDVE